MKINWNNLKSFKCPDCGEVLKAKNHLGMIECSKCPFGISMEKLGEIVAKIKLSPITMDGTNNLDVPDEMEGKE